VVCPGIRERPATHKTTQLVVPDEGRLVDYKETNE
jgi:hypothetical protein